MLGQSMTNQNNQVHAHVNENGGSVAARVCDFVRINPPECLGSQANEDPQNFLDGIKKMFEVMQDSGNDRVELTSYQLKDVAHFGTLSVRRIGVQMRLLSLGIGLVRLFLTGFS